MEAENRSSSGAASSSSSSFRALLLVLLLPAIFILLFLPSFLSHRPILLKNGWDTVNLVLVLFAILCGLFAPRNKDDDDNDNYQSIAVKSPADPWPETDSAVSAAAAADTVPDPEYRPVGIRRMRSSSSYPDLRQQTWWGPPDTDAWRFSDDIQLYRSSPRRSSSAPETIPVDTFEIRKSPPPQSRSQSPPPPPPPPPKKRIVKKLPPTEEPDLPPPPRSRSPPRSTPPPPPPPPPMSPVRVEIKRMERKKSGGAKDIATALAQFYQKKKKRSKSKKIYIDETIIADTGSVSVSVPPSTPPPPPPPPPPSMFQQLFKKSTGGKSSKRHHHHSFPPPPPPPPAKKKHESPPPQNPIHNRKHKPRSNRYPLPPSPLRPSNQPIPYYSIPMPPPPPPPPSEDVDEPAKEVEQGQQFCPSPDVNNKAEMFIARFRAGLHLEKLNSIKLKEEQQQQQEEEITVAAA